MSDTNELLCQIAELKAQNKILQQERDSYYQQWELLSDLLNSYDGAIWYINTEYRLLTYNRYFEEDMIRIFGRIPQKGDFVFGNQSIDSPQVLFWINHYDKVLAGNNAVFSFPISTPHKEEYYECYLFPAKDKLGKIIGVYCFKQDITERKKVESLMKRTQEKLSLAHQVAKLGMWTLYLDTEEIHLYKEMQMMLELDPPYPNPLVMPLSEYQKKFVQSHSQGVFSLGIVNIFANKDNIGYEDKYEYILHSAKGNERIIFVKRKIVQKGIIEGVSQDITEFRTIEKEHAQLTSDLVQKVKDAEQFTYIVSHNLRSPVARLLGLASIFQVETENQHNHFVVQTIQKVAVQLDTVIKDLNSILSLKKDIQEDLALISLAELLENVKEFVRSDIEKSGAIIQIDVSRTPEILAISSYAHSIFTNFLTNAIKYKHPDREPIIKITSIVTDRYIRIDITDNGIGMDIEKVKSRLFSPFSRFHASTKIEGKGLGLFLVKSQIEAIGGKIEVHSETEIGTTFFIYFPIHS